MSRLAVIVLGLALLGGCKKKSCEKLVEIGCDRIRMTDRKDPDTACETLRRQSEAVDDEQCSKTLRLLEQSGKIRDLGE